MLARRRTIVQSFVVAFFLLNLYYFWHRAPRLSTLPLPDRQAQLWRYLYPLLEQYAPNCAKPSLRGGPGVVRYDALKEIHRENYISNVDQFQQPMRTAHDGFVNAIRDSRVDGAYIPGTMGIVTSAGGTYLPTFVVSLLLLRRTGTSLPIELFMEDQSEYEPHICEKILPPLGVKCLILSDIMTPPQTDQSISNSDSDSDNPKFNPSTFTIEGFQLKSFAMLFTSFEKFLWLDADCVPLHDTLPLLTSPPFTTTGLVTWPDFFANTAAPIYFNISRQPDPPSTTRQSSEAGMLLINKQSHLLTLLLSAYYNFYGPDYYYTLLDQGAPGAGDKDTFLHAAAALNQSFYAVSEPVIDLGNITPWNNKVAINAGYIQADPIQDYQLTSNGKWRVRDPSISKPPRAFFIHAGAPEFNPGNELLGPKLSGFDGLPTRLWSYPAEAMKRLGFDAERMFWEEVMAVACGDGEYIFETWRGREEEICEGVWKHWEAVFADGVVQEGLEFTGGSMGE
ncbi:mannosyltransferase putative-domain-containing protein [Aspergillus egyptiacus]|nr:mannosyltransferase putative-domain-containing protein [Aspergillus egyptiacus]